MKKGILVIREFDKFSALLAENELEVVNLPLIETERAEDLSNLDASLKKKENYDGLFLTSPIAAEIFLERCRALNYTFGGKIYVLGGRTKTLFENAGFEVVFREGANTAEEFINSFQRGEFDGKRFLFLRGDKSLRTIPELLKDAADVNEVFVYRTVKKHVAENLLSRVREKIKSGGFYWVCFFSPSGVERFIETFGTNLLENINIAAIGPTTSRTINQSGRKANFVSHKSSAEDFALGLIEYLREEEVVRT